MNITEFRDILSANPNLPIRFVLPDESVVPAHFHITEVGRVEKNFIDCGGTVRSLTTCVMQVWVANDKEHRLESAKLLKILDIATPLLKSNSLAVEVEYELNYVSQFPVNDFKIMPNEILFQLGTKHTDCLAKEKCGVSSLNVTTNEGCCSTSNCC
jgi:hypothetical protein